MCGLTCEPRPSWNQPPGDELNVISQYGEVHGVARERHGDPGLHGDGRSRARGQRQRDEGIVPSLGDSKAVVTVGLGGGFDAKRTIGNVRGGVDQHAGDPFR